MTYALCRGCNELVGPDETYCASCRHDRDDRAQSDTDDSRESMLADVQSLLCAAADKLDAFDHDHAMQADLRAKAFTLHQELDPHCSCSACLQAMRV